MTPVSICATTTLSPALHLSTVVPVVCVRCSASSARALRMPLWRKCHQRSHAGVTAPFGQALT